jgi:hypothetical protein
MRPALLSMAGLVSYISSTLAMYVCFDGASIPPLLKTFPPTWSVIARRFDELALCLLAVLVLLTWATTPSLPCY